LLGLSFALLGFFWDVNLGRKNGFEFWYWGKTRAGPVPESA